jgi:hypothetical protein
LNGKSELDKDGEQDKDEDGEESEEPRPLGAVFLLSAIFPKQGSRVTCHE